MAPALNTPAALLAAYLVVTALATVRPPATGSRALHVGAMLVALGVGLTSVTFGLEAIATSGSCSGRSLSLSC